jgi:hypothetical protein
MKLSGCVVPLRRRHERITEFCVVAIFAETGGGELLVTHHVAAMDDIERAAFFAARSQRADPSVQQTGA